MDSVLFILGDFPVTVTLAVAGLIVLLLLALLIVNLRSNTRQIEEAAHTASEGLRASFTEQIAQRDMRIRELDEKLAAKSEDNSRLREEAASLRTRLSEQQRQNEENLKRFQSARQQMTDEFKVIATEILQTHGATFSKQNKEQVDALLKPLNEKIGEFQKGLIEDRVALGAEIKRLSEDSLRMSTEANNLTRALKGSSQTQGAWGEMILSTILEGSGLREGEQFITQASHTGETGARLRTDVEVMMPNGDSLVIDSKVSLTAFEAYANASEEGERELHLRAHITSLRAHIKTLSGKEYHRHSGSGLDFVTMFVPIEGALAAAVSADPGLLEYSLSQSVQIATPTTLMSVLRTVRNVWDIEKRHQNAEVIAERAGRLYDKVAGFLGSMDRLGQQLGRAQASFDEAKGQLSAGAGNMVRQVEMLRDLGAKSSKQIPEGWLSGEDADEAPPEALPPPLDETAEQ